ncbi:MAG: phosphoenolpyruvate mutase, partial [Bradymonadia bacterium]
MKASIALRALLAGERAGVLLEAHDTASALVAERAGVQGIWASSLTLSCANGYRDDSTLGMAASLDRLEAMAERVDIPIVFDGDTGYGDFAHTEQLVRRLCARGVAGLTIEDKRMPKRNSFIGSEAQRLAPIEEFCGKIAAAKDVQRDSDFVVVGRTEALIVGAGLDAALERAERYAEAGADAILMHCKDPVFDQVEAFMRMWSGVVPVVIVPTTYADTPVERFDAAGIKLVVWANHALRAAVHTMGRLAAHVARHRTVIGAPVAMDRVSDLFALQDVAAFTQRERRFSGYRVPTPPGPTAATIAHPVAPAATAAQVLDALDAAGVRVVSGVPCSVLGGLVTQATAAGRYVPASVEGEAVAVCAGAWLAGGFGAALMQSSGLGNAINPVASLLQPYRIPALLIVSWRGEPGVDDAEHQRPMGRATPALLDALDIPWAIIESGERVAAQIAGLSDRARREGGPVALLVPKRAALKAEARPPELARARSV